MNCVVCNTKLKDEKDVLTICEKKECKKHLESMAVGEYVVSWLRYNPAVAHIHLILGYKAFRHARWQLIAHPYPAYFDKHEDLLNATILFKELFSEAHENDEELARRIGKESYILVKFILMTAPPLELIEAPEGCKILAVPNAEKLDRPVFHGSSEENWYSIIRNGLKVCSGTVWQKNGASFGDGIYLGKTIGVSCGYTRGDQIVGVYKLEKEPKNHGDILVATDKSDITLQYVIISKELTTDLQQKIMRVIKK